MRFKLFILAAASCLASCGLDLPPSEGRYTINSDCPGATATAGTLDIPEVSNVLSVFTVKDAEQFGFPTTLFSYELGGIMESKSGTRLCQAQLFVKDSEHFIFLCKENGANLCTITGEKL